MFPNLIAIIYSYKNTYSVLPLASVKRKDMTAYLHEYMETYIVYASVRRKLLYNKMQ